MPKLNDIFDEISAIQQWQDRARRADNAALSWSPRQVNDMRAAHRLYPDIRAGSLLALARGGYRPDHPLVTQVAELSARLNLRDHPNGQDYGTAAVTPGMNRARARQVQDATRADYARADAQLAHAPDIPAAVAENTDALAAWRAATDAGLVEGGFLVQPGMKAGDPQSFVWKDVLDRFVAAGVAVPVMHNGRPQLSQPTTETEWRERHTRAVREAEAVGNENSADIHRAELAEGFTPGHEFVDIPGLDYSPLEGPDAGPGLLDQARRATGTRASNPAELEVAGMADVGLTAVPRTAFQAMDFGVQEFQGQVRNLYAGLHGMDPDWLSTQSDLGLALTTDLDSGSGFFTDPESELAAERRRREAERGTIGGHNVTLGRWVADELLPSDPDSKPFMVLSGLVDLGVQVFADPTALALGKAGTAARSRRLFAAAGDDAVRAAGGVRGLRSVVRPMDAQRWLDSETGVRSVEWLAQQRSPTEVWRAMNHKINMDTAVRLADAPDTAAVRNVLEPELGTRIREVSTATVGGGRSAADPRRVMPLRGRIDAHDNDIVAFEMESYLRNAGAGTSQSAEIVDQVARAGTPVQLNAAIRNGLRRADGLLDAEGVTDEVLRARLTNLHRDTHEAVHATVRAAMTTHGPSSTPVMVGGQATDVLDPVLVTELAPRFLSLPDPRAIRRVRSRYSNLLTKGSVFETTSADPRMATTVVEFLQNEMWKPLQLIRAAWTIRVVGEEQLRMAAAGYDSMFKHPLSYIAWRTGRPERAPVRSLRHPFQTVDTLPGAHPFRAAADLVGRKGQTGFTGDLIDEANDFTNAMSRSHGNWIDRSVVPTGIKTTFSVNDLARREDYVANWGSELLRLHGDPVARQVANSGSLDEVVEWFTRGGGNGFRGDLAEAYPGKFDSLDQARGYIEGVQARIHHMTGGDPDLLDAVKSGKLGDDPLLGGTTLNRGVIPSLESKVGSVGPQDVPGYETVNVPTTAGARALGWWQDSVVDRLFGALMTNRTNNLSRSPVFKQSYWREGERLVAAMSPEAKTATVAAAREAGISRRAISRMERTPARRGPTLPADVPSRQLAGSDIRDANLEALSDAGLSTTGRPGYHEITDGTPVSTLESDVRAFGHFDDSGEMDASLLVFHDENGRPFSLNVYVKPELRRQGVGTELYSLAERRGIDVESVSLSGTSTPQGRAFAQGRRAKTTARGLTVEEADLLAKGNALEEVKTLLYDLSRRGRFMDAARLVFPFGEAWSEVLTRWLGPDGLIARNPKVVRRFQQTVQGARGEDFGEVMGAPEGEGFFWKNEFGDEVFLYPGMGLLTEKLIGVEIPLAGRVEGLSMFGTVIPGLGPAVQIPAGWVLQNKPGPQFVKDALTQLELWKAPEGVPVVGGSSVKEQLVPFGSIGSDDPGDVTDIRNFVPTWMRTAFDFVSGGHGNEEAYGNAQMAVAAYKLTTGEYGSTPAERQRLMEDSARDARWFFLIKAVAQGFAPAAPSEDWRVVDENGQSLRVRALAEEYRTLQTENYEAADREFLNRYSEDILAAVQAKSAGVEYSLPVTAEGVAWVTENPEVNELLPHTYGFFAPKGGEFDYALYSAQVERGERHRLNLKEWTALMFRTKGDMIYEDAQSQVGDQANTDEGRAFLRETREWIADNYDGWGDKAGIPNRPDTDVLIRELERALDVPAVMATDAGQGLKLYLEGRAEVLAYAQEQGYAGIGEADELEDARIYLNDLAGWVVDRHPGFKELFDVVFSRETEVTEDGT